MKRLLIVFSIIGCIYGCKGLQSRSFEGNCYVNPLGYPHDWGSILCFYPGNKFKFIERAAGVHISEGTWIFDNKRRTITLTTVPVENSEYVNTRLDTIWNDLTGTKVNVRNKRQIVYDRLLYKVNQGEYEKVKGFKVILFFVI